MLRIRGDICEYLLIIRYEAKSITNSALCRMVHAHDFALCRIAQNHDYALCRIADSHHIYANISSNFPPWGC
jgi:hypothetical protein